MNKLIFIENVYKTVFQNLRLYTPCIARNYGDEKKDLDKDFSAKSDDKNKASKDRLNSLLKAMVNDSSKQSHIDLPLAKPTKKIAKQKKLQEQQQKSSIDNLNENIVEAVKSVAKHVGGNVQQTESELLTKLLLHKHGSDGAENLPNSLSDLIVGMKIDRDKKPKGAVTSRAQYVRQNIGQSKDGSVTRHKVKRNIKSAAAKAGGRVELFGGISLGIFTKKEELKDQNQLLTMEMLNQRELKLAIMHPPENYFQKMILWTEQGKLWKFPIDNEQGLDEERSVYFAEHVFLDHHLEGWCPTKGPVRHFMELVCVGLSKNPYLTVQEKINHIEWFQNYFKEKQSLLMEVGAIQSDNVLNKTNIKELE